MVDIKIDISRYGPILNNMAPAIVERFTADARHEVAQAAMAAVHKNLDASIRKPTPYYETQITTTREERDDVVHDRRVVYGPWLEGVSARNRTSRFKGYASFRRAAQEVDRRVPELVAVVMRRLIARLS
jgi:hypothetical protein